jgi:hypothetical protein
VAARVRFIKRTQSSSNIFFSFNHNKIHNNSWICCLSHVSLLNDNLPPPLHILLCTHRLHFWRFSSKCIALVTSYTMSLNIEQQLTNFDLVLYPILLSKIMIFGLSVNRGFDATSDSTLQQTRPVKRVMTLCLVPLELRTFVKFSLL